MRLAATATAAAVRLHLAVATVAAGFEQQDAELISAGYAAFDAALIESQPTERL